MARKLALISVVLQLDLAVVSIFPTWAELVQGISHKYCRLFRERMVILMLHRPRPPFPPVTNLSTGTVRVSKGEDR